MISKLSILAITALYFFAPSVNGQEECRPTQVMYVTITAESLLYWEFHPKEPCLIDEYIVRILGDREEEDRELRVKENSVDVSFLEICKEWTFVVTAVAAGVLGYERRHIGRVPLPPDSNLAISSFEVLDVDSRDVVLAWDLEDRELRNCSLEYRIVVEDQETGEMEDIYVPGGLTQMHNFAPCVAYELSIRAINKAMQTIEGPPSSMPFEMPAFPEEPPSVDDIVVGSTTADLRFSMESFGHNRCPLKTLFVDAGNNFNITLPLEHIEGEKRPVEVNLRALRPDSMYYLKVYVENSAGVSRPAQFALQTLPEDQPGPGPN